MKHAGSTWIVMASLVAFVSGAAQGADIEPPKVQVVDKFGVNMANGQVTHSLDLLNIGGEMGLSESVSVYANDFNFKGYRGFNHKYFARAADVELSYDVNFSPHHIMRVYDHSGSVDFAYYIGTALQQTGDATSGYSYKPLGDERHILEVSGNFLVWTKPDGTVVKFDRGTVTPKRASTGGLMTEIKYPNGFTVTVTSGGMSVNTNTGFQLKDLYVDDGTSWSTFNPKHVVGINAAVEYCAWTATTCTLTNDWPRATFVWPAGMPHAMYSGTKNVSVTDAQGRTTKYRFLAYDLAYNGSTVVDGYTPGQRFSPRLVGITPPGSTVETITYEYKNLFLPGAAGFDVRLQESGVVTRATRNGLLATYNMLEPYYEDTQNTASSLSDVNRVHIYGKVNGALGAMYYVVTDDGTAWFERSPRNFITSFDKIAAPKEGYGYTRGNLTTIGYRGVNGTVSWSVGAEYPTACTSSTRKTCNQPTRTRDANGNWTDYGYHAPSGQVARITYPANKHGVRPETRFDYAERTARYYDSSGSKITGTPIWMKTAEKYCINSAAVNGVCTGADEVVTRYEYSHDNLLMTGMTVTDPDGDVRRTCFRYDIYGNQIGKTTPNANLSSCP